MRVPHRLAERNSTNDVTSDTMGGGSDSKDLFGVRADVLIPGRGEPIPNGGIVISISEGIIVWVGPYADLPSKYSDVSFTKHSGAIMPGLWDVHTHFGGANVVSGLNDAIKSFMPGTQFQIGAVTVDDLRATLMAGFTSVRELGGMAGYLQPMIDNGAIVGPTVYSALCALSITGGHGDQHDCPLGLVRGENDGSNGIALCDGVDDCIKMVRSVVRNGAKVIKICSSGGVLSINDQPEDTQFSPAEIEAIVNEAARSGRVVAAHAIGKPGIINALRAGVKSIEHGMYLDKEVADLMKEKGAILVPTRHIVESLAAGSQDLPPVLLKKLNRLVQLSRDSYKLAVAEGVRVALGTDTLSSDRKNPLAHGRNAKELHWMKVAGMTPLQAIEAATATPPETLGRQGPQAGQLKEGFDADIIAVSKNPLDDVDVLTDPTNITHVWKGGKLFKST
ncbi:midohydrolase [Diaporthe amygdali]|uniref:midohydrolase n=1 Tax=Phomopsis amygdali TaxID=1214568 RepID=UPI0022FE2D78|nr:midohydrolase [Diaporthe amygdali]KAJ0117965.1 midohydrolase [Diaporthe amygdali]